MRPAPPNRRPRDPINTHPRGRRDHRPERRAARPGALIRLESGQVFRLTADASRVHFETDERRRNVLHISRDPENPREPSQAAVRALLGLLCSAPVPSAGARKWRLRQGPADQWRLSLELAGVVEGKVVRFPETGDELGEPVSSLVDLERLYAVASNLLRAAGEFELGLQRADGEPAA